MDSGAAGIAPALLVECQNYIDLSKVLVSTWLGQYMFKTDPQAKRKPGKVAAFLANEKNFLSHARRVDIDQLKGLGVKAASVAEHDSQFQDAIRQLHLAVMATLDNTGAVKIFENSQGDALIRLVQIGPMQPAP